MLISDIDLLNLISITDQTEENLESLEPETELDPPTKSPGKMIRFKLLNFFLYYRIGNHH